MGLPARFTGLSCSFAVVFRGERASPPATSARAAPRSSTAAGPGAVWRGPSSRFRTRFVYFDVAASQFFAIQSSDRAFCFFVVGHFHERESSRSAGFPVHRHVNARDLAKRRKNIAQLAFRGLKTQIAYKQVLHVFLTIERCFPIQRYSSR
jgi:hypothetical protein